ncbi:dol-P-Man:Man(5)GlcNAc(2)-PP-Dol alpha-1,3-mannosyltransferase-like isoform X2 [Salvia hispanica]|uniref:dol-P-Man:Man(5)GlcNAc(2)-PP-Dol alpha-1,3-mannosyltransferase-like isoform X2 n=1 Tax=Salvia hispanica TaxID=49212 RepID=UPI002009A167|nr:dol-P-Man:Man(5)GlcNAc(2)-PP-Dol alpha-1,3-mannosyltransferase-like isoform X2 [Salvia hispanica]
MPRQTSAARSTSAATGLKAEGTKNMHFFKKVLKNPKLSSAVAVLLADAVLVSLIIAYVPYTKIDWDAYMSQVTGFLGGERDYSKLKGDTGPLVYPAGFLYIYSAIQYVTGGEVYPAQLPWWALCLLTLSKRLHSIFVLRLFNDCFATTMFHAALISFLYQKWHLGLIIFSGAVSVKMNVLLFAPPLLLLLLKAMDVFGVISAGAGAAIVQILLALPFILSHPVAYFSRAFNLGRVFVHFWSVNFKFVPEPVFISKGFALFLLAAHLLLLAVFAHYKWCRHEGGLFSFLHCKLAQMKLKFINPTSFPLRGLNEQNINPRVLKTEHIATTMFVGNFVGVVCARSLHYQFYSWYFYSLPYLLWRTPFPTWFRLILFVMVELCWNIFPSNIYSSTLLLCAHLIILVGLWMAPPEYPYMDNTTNGKPANSKKAR